MPRQGLVQRAAAIVAHHEDVRRVGPEDIRLGAALERFLLSVVPEMGLGSEPLHIHLRKESEYGRDMHFFGLDLPKGPSVTVKADPGPTGKAVWTISELRALCAADDRGLLRAPSAWVNPFFAGMARTRLVWWGSAELWSQCGRMGADAMRLAWETLHGSAPWEWFHYGSKERPGWDPITRKPTAESVLSTERLDVCREVRELALELFPKIVTAVEHIPMHILRHRRSAGHLQAIAYYLVEDPMGPGLTKSAAALATGTEPTVFSRSLEGYFANVPNARRWPKKRPKAHEIKEIPLASTMAHQ
jgi:hypothetical protein